MNEAIKMQLMGYCEGVKLGTKPAAMMSIQTRYQVEATEVVETYGIKCYIEDVEEDSIWKVLWIYKYDYLLDVIKQMPKHPNSKYDHWVLGKLFGYSDEAIKNFLN